LGAVTEFSVPVSDPGDHGGAVFAGSPSAAVAVVVADAAVGRVPAASVTLVPVPARLVWIWITCSCCRFEEPVPRLNEPVVNPAVLLGIVPDTVIAPDPWLAWPKKKGWHGDAKGCRVNDDPVQPAGDQKRLWVFTIWVPADAIDLLVHVTITVTR
jgi:hypothetical protein